MVECVPEFGVFDDSNGVVNFVEGGFRWGEFEGRARFFRRFSYGYHSFGICI